MGAANARAQHHEGGSVVTVRHAVLLDQFRFGWPAQSRMVRGADQAGTRQRGESANHQREYQCGQYLPDGP